MFRVITSLIICLSAVISSGLMPLSEFANSVAAQDLLIDESIGGFDEIDEPTQENPVTLGSHFIMKPDSREGVLRVKALIADNWHLYSVTQPAGGPMRSVIKIVNDNVTLQGDFKPDNPPHVENNAEGFDVPVEDHGLEVTWSAPIRIDDDVDVESLKLEVKFNGQTCVSSFDGSIGTCKPLFLTMNAEFAGFMAAPAEPPFKPRSHLAISGTLTSEGVVKPGSMLKIQITAEPTGIFHVYAYENAPAETRNPTLFALTKSNGWKIGEITASEDFVTHETGGDPQYYHEGPVTWTIEVEVPADAANKTFSLGGLIGFQTCTDLTCDPPESAEFSAELTVGKKLPDDLKLKFKAAGSYNDVAKEVDRLAGKKAEEEKAEEIKGQDKQQEAVVSMATPEEIEEMAKLYDAETMINFVTINDIRRSAGETVKEPAKTTFWTALVGAFLGGMLLNLMPCVFPVLGIKVLGFVEQAGSEKNKIRMHGVAFAAGLVISMWVLAAIILIIKISLGKDVNWGLQMSSPLFVGSIILLMYILGLNMAGVFEIGTNFTRAGGKLDKKKGYSGSFFSGILTTVVATPCSGPFLGVAMSYTLAQTVPVAMFLFTIFGLGIASPYLFLAFFPVLIQKLPRPGAWMETFKVTMSFALFATAAFFMQTFGGQTGVAGLSWLIMAMVVIGLGLYFYGRWSMPYIKAFKRYSCGFALPIVLAGIGFYMAYDASGYPAPPQQHAGWLNWHPGRVEHTLAKHGKIIWVDYTALW